eukprot:TRINITY_DN14793_c0_g1_i1.p1 TRINITY_DN14793_c0_g1~~TRINITY_DN14793_c0_g1_i1.p1  ORF type:complete len:221 (+),score=39.02 TRINITY_DN14793_c0_g1_i1:100-663(+)
MDRSVAFVVGLPVTHQTAALGKSYDVLASQRQLRLHAATQQDAGHSSELSGQSWWCVAAAGAVGAAALRRRGGLVTRQAGSATKKRLRDLRRQKRIDERDALAEQRRLEKEEEEKEKDQVPLELKIAGLLGAFIGFAAVVQFLVGVLEEANPRVPLPGEPTAEELANRPKSDRCFVKNGNRECLLKI